MYTGGILSRDGIKKCLSFKMKWSYRMKRPNTPLDKKKTAKTEALGILTNSERFYIINTHKDTNLFLRDTSLQ